MSTKKWFRSTLPITPRGEPTPAAALAAAKASVEKLPSAPGAPIVAAGVVGAPTPPPAPPTGDRLVRTAAGSSATHAALLTERLDLGVHTLTALLVALACEWRALPDTLTCARLRTTWL